MFENFAIVLISALMGKCMVYVMLVTGHLTQHACDYTRYTRAVIILSIT